MHSSVLVSLRVLNYLRLLHGLRVRWICRHSFSFALGGNHMNLACSTMSPLFVKPAPSLAHDHQIRIREKTSWWNSRLYPFSTLGETPSPHWARLCDLFPLRPHMPRLPLAPAEKTQPTWSSAPLDGGSSLCTNFSSGDIWNNCVF